MRAQFVPLLLLLTVIPLTSNVYASIGSDEFCAQNPGHFACDNENDNDSDDDGKSDDNERECENPPTAASCNSGTDANGVGSNNGPNPYCDTDKGKSAPVCHDRKDYSQSTGLYPCNDGTNKVDWRDCKDATDGDNVGEEKSRDNDGVEDEVITENDESCYDEGYEDGQNGPFNKLTHSQCEGGNGDNDYYIGFRLGCTNAGNTIDVCESAADK